MSFPTLLNVLDQARSILADDEVSGGQMATNLKLIPKAQEAVRKLFRTLRNIGAPRVIKEVYFVVPINTGVVVPSTANINDLYEPILLEERGNLTSVNVSGIATSGGVVTVTTSGSHGFSTGDYITQNGAGGVIGAEGIWGITNSGSTTFTLNGCVLTGSYTSGGKVVKSTDAFNPMVGPKRIQDGAPGATAGLLCWDWTGGAFRLSTSTTERQLRIVYYSSAEVPTATGDTIAVEDSIDFLANYTAAAFAQSQLASGIGDRLMVKAEGKAAEDGTYGGLLGELVRAAVKAYQSRPPNQNRRQPFRQPRINSPYYI